MIESLKTKDFDWESEDLIQWDPVTFFIQGLSTISWRRYSVVISSEDVFYFNFSIVSNGILDKIIFMSPVWVYDKLLHLSKLFVFFKF